MGEPLHIKYRPTTLAGVLGQDAVVKSLSQQLNGKHTPHAFLFTGPSGTGKTTLARIIALSLGCSNPDEIDAATNSGKEEMKTFTSGLRYHGFEPGAKVAIIDECHALTKQAWQATLKILEEPPAHVYFVFCTTEGNQIINTVRTRCASYELKPVARPLLEELLLTVMLEEKLNVSDEALDMIINESKGSPRQALVFLSMAEGISDLKELGDLIKTAGEPKEMNDLMALLTNKNTPQWASIRNILQNLKEDNPESIRLGALRYITSCILRSNTNGEAERFHLMLEAFSYPFSDTREGLAPLLLAIGRCIHGR